MAGNSAGEPTPGSNDTPAILSVSQLTSQIEIILEGTFPDVWVAGEISNFSRSHSGHCYLTLKDQEAQLRAVLWRTTAARVRFELADGLEVICQGGLDVYPPRGTYQLVIRQIQPRGVGALELALRQLHARLAAEGLFDAQRKRDLPRFPRRVAVVTSPTGAAIRDFLEVLRRRWRATDVLLAPTRVQGEGAAAEIAAAIAAVNRIVPPVDVLVVTRGGGSLEDLWAFNDEVVVRAIDASRVPVVSAVGHEIDVTLADLVADVRALTPSEAAERVVPAAEAVEATLRQWQSRLHAAMRGHLLARRSRLEAIAVRRPLRQPLERVRQLTQRLDELSWRAQRGVNGQLERVRLHLAQQAARLDALSPLAVLARGYSLTEHGDGQLVRTAHELHVGQPIVSRFADGRVQSRVERVEPADSGDASSEPR